NTASGSDTIVFDNTVFNFHKMITLAKFSGQLELTDTAGSTTITGPEAGVTVNGGVRIQSRVFQVDKGVTASLSGLTIIGGYTDIGAGLWNVGSLSLTNCTFIHNFANEGGGLRNSGYATLTNCTFDDNSASDGGGLYNKGTLKLTNCTVSRNTSTRYG